MTIYLDAKTYYITIPVAIDNINNTILHIGIKKTV